jgi:hypothetical protein
VVKTDDSLSRGRGFEPFAPYSGWNVSSAAIKLKENKDN